MQNNLWDLFHNLNYSQIVFNEKGTIESISSSILSQMEIPEDKVGLFPSLLKLRFYEDLFSGPFGVKVLSHFENYRIILNTYHTKRSLLFNVSGIFSDNPGKVITLWQLVNVENTSPDDLSEGSIFENIHIQKIVAPYISDLILDKAIQSIKRGQKTLPNEIKDLTIMFLDLIGFTHQSENMDPHEVINLLNTVMGVTVHCIETNQGMIDKFLGDGIMSIFTDPLSAVVAAIEIQNNLYQLNAFRSAAELPSINARIGINSGSVILGSVGTKRRMDWTALGDVVNTASRIEKQSRKHSVLVSSNTYERIKNQVHIQGELIVNVKGKDKDLNLVFVNSVTFQRKGESITLTLSDESPELPVTSPEFPHKQSHKGSVTIQ
jgi:class 3 adenylate cyclase